MATTPNPAELQHVTSAARPASSLAMVFVSFLLALALRAALEVFAEPLSRYGNASVVWGAVKADPNRQVLLLAQLIVFVALMSRFYLGSIRYYEDKLSRGARSEVDADFILVVALFMSFYFAGRFARTTSQFYYALLALHLVDLGWFLWATTFGLLAGGMQKVGSWYVLFDIVTAGVILIVGLAFSYGAGDQYLWGQWLMLATVAGVTIWDFRKLRPFYKNSPGWEEQLTKAPLPT